MTALDRIDGPVPDAPAAYLDNDGQKIDARGSQGVYIFLLMTGVRGLLYYSFPLQHIEPVRQDIRCDLLLRLQEFPEMALSFEHDIPDDQQAPLIPKDFHRNVHRASRSVLF